MATAFNDVRQDPEFLAKARRFDPSKGHSPMWTLLGELVRPPMLNPQEELDANDASGVQHALNALYCDYILLDRGWTSKLNQARPRLEKAGIDVARCYSPKQRDIEQFLSDLAAHPVLTSSGSKDEAE
ncbi:hypothetical protein SAMN04515659_0552 [Dyella sp. 333MFSha]|nr:hypothetical protein SAMN04515659_0552 [Dyella sp. 333MFSha]